MRHQSCNFGDEFKFFHPKKVKNDAHDSHDNYNYSHKNNDNHLTYAEIVTRNVQPQVQDAFLRQI